MDDEYKVNVVPRLLEFFERESLHNWFHELEEHGADPVEYFLRLEKITVDKLVSTGKVPSFRKAISSLLIYQDHALNY